MITLRLSLIIVLIVDKSYQNILSKNRTFVQNSKFCPKIEISSKNQNFGRKSNFWSNIQFLFATQNFDQKYIIFKTAWGLTLINLHKLAKVGTITQNLSSMLDNKKKIMLKKSMKARISWCSFFVGMRTGTLIPVPKIYCT